MIVDILRGENIHSTDTIFITNVVCEQKVLHSHSHTLHVP